MGKVYSGTMVFRLCSSFAEAIEAGSPRECLIKFAPTTGRLFCNASSRPVVTLTTKDGTPIELGELPSNGSLVLEDVPALLQEMVQRDLVSGAEEAFGIKATWEYVASAGGVATNKINLFYWVRPGLLLCVGCRFGFPSPLANGGFVCHDHDIRPGGCDLNPLTPVTT